MLGLRRTRTLQSHRRPVIVAAWTRTTAAPTPQQHSEQKNPSDTPGNRLPKPNRDPTSARRTTFAKLHSWTLHSHLTTSLFTEPLTTGDSETMPQQERDAEAPPSPDPGI